MSISVKGFVPARPDHPSERRFPDIESAAARVFEGTAVRGVEITNTGGTLAELYVVDFDGTRLRALFDYYMLAMANDSEQWWEDALRREWEQLQQRRAPANAF